MRYSGLAVLGLAMLTGSAAIAQTGTLTEAREIVAALSGPDRTARLMAITRGLGHADKAIRVVTLNKLLTSSDGIAMEIAAFPGDTPAAQNLRFLPNFAITEIAWKGDGQSFTANYQSSRGAISGSLIGETINISYPTVIVTKEPSGYINTQCTITMTLNAARNALEGPLRCNNVAYRFLARLGF